MIWKFKKKNKPKPALKLEESSLDPKTEKNLAKNEGKANRKLEIGPGDKRISGFETLNIVDGPTTDYILDAAKKMPFQSDTFEVIYASHILEHIPWYQSALVLEEWIRILKKGGWLEVWVPDGLKIAKAFVEAEAGNEYFHEDGWYRFNEDKDPCVWAAGRIFTYGDGTGNTDHPNWHRAIFSERYLRKLFEQANLDKVSRMEREEVRGYDHEWINLGVKGQKK
jgi:SAM-dependent methyltransferase